MGDKDYFVKLWADYKAEGGVNSADISPTITG